MKHAIVTPLLKKSTLNPDQLKNYRPVSNLTFISKLLERVISTRLSQHKDNHQLREPMQSAYRERHSTESAILRIHNDVLRAMDQGQCTLLVMLDLSAAFNTVDHQILLKRLSNVFGVHTLLWIESYLHNRKQTVIVNGIKSKEKTMTCMEHHSTQTTQNL